MRTSLILIEKDDASENSKGFRASKIFEDKWAKSGKQISAKDTKPSKIFIFHRRFSPKSLL